MKFKSGKAVFDALANPTLSIQRGVPIPPERNKSNSALYIAARAMEIGDCIDVPYSRTGVASNLSRAVGYTFTQRKVGKLLRIWRTA